eukprot:jgi/Tetstr1/450045/TSEL_037092.t1
MEPPGSGAAVRAPTVALVATTLATNLLFSGLIFGWGPIKLLLSQDGVYRDLCPEDQGGADGAVLSAGSCLARESAFARIYSTAGVVAQLSGVACGAISDHFGPQATIALGGSLVSSCLLGLGWLDPPAEQAWLLVAVYAVLTFGCFLLLFSSFSCAFIWRAQQATILTCANVFFDASASVSLLLYQLYDTAGLSRGPLLTGYAALAATAAAAQILLWVPNTAMLRAAKQAAPGGEAPAQQQGDAEGAEQPLLQGEQGTQGQQQQGGGGLWAQLRSADFAFLATFGAAHVFRSIVFMGTFSSLLWQYGDEVAGYRYTKLFSAELPTCVLFIPAVSWTLRHCSWATTFQIINVVGLAWNGLAFVPWLPAQAATGVLYVAFRAFLFSCLFGFCASTFGAATAGRVYGFSNLVASAAVTLQLPVVEATYRYAGGDFRYLYAAMAVLVLPLLLLTHCAMRPKQLEEVPVPLPDGDGGAREGPASS